jgi:hypothetical protein
LFEWLLLLADMILNQPELMLLLAKVMLLLLHLLLL